jgi:hypothetical protein
MIQQLMQELQSLKAQEGNDQAKVAIDAKKVEIDAYKAETDRLKVELEAQAAQQVIPQEPQQTVQEQGIDLSPIVQMLQQLEQRISQPQQPIVINTGAATRKQARAVKQPDGSWAMESVEVPEEGI